MGSRRTRAARRRAATHSGRPTAIVHGGRAGHTGRSSRSSHRRAACGRSPGRATSRRARGSRGAKSGGDCRAAMVAVPAPRAPRRQGPPQRSRSSEAMRRGGAPQCAHCPGVGSDERLTCALCASAAHAASDQGEGPALHHGGRRWPPIAPTARRGACLISRPLVAAVQRRCWWRLRDAIK
jgi:hypothetical protein